VSCGCGDGVEAEFAVVKYGKIGPKGKLMYGLRSVKSGFLLGFTEKGEPLKPRDMSEKMRTQVAFYVFPV
jgi:hypothetical protein